MDEINQLLELENQRDLLLTPVGHFLSFHLLQGMQQISLNGRYRRLFNCNAFGQRQTCYYSKT